MTSEPDPLQATPPKCGHVRAVTGDTSPDTLGVTLSAEHVVADLAPTEDTPSGWAAAGRQRPRTPGDWRTYHAPLTMPLLGEITRGAPNRDNWLLPEHVVLPDLESFATDSGRTIVDVTTADRGRDPQALARLARTSGISTIMGCGWSAPSRVGGLADRTADDLTAELVGELVTGVDGIRAGVIGEIGPLDPASPVDQTVIQAVARAAASTGAPVLIRPPRTGRIHQVLDRLAAGGADLARVAVHCSGSWATDPDTLTDLAGRGVFVQFSGFGRPPTVYSTADGPDIAATILQLARSGCRTNQILLSPGVSAKADLLTFGGGGYAFLTEQFLPYLRFRGGDDRLLDALTIGNPRRWLTTEEGRS